jgi:hypothetical protein
MIPRGRRGLVVLLGALAIVGAGVLTGVGLTRGSSGAAAGAPRSAAVPAGQAGSAAGFTMTVPAGWQTAQRGAGTEFTSPAGDVSILVTPTPTATGGLTALGQVRRQLAQIVAQGSFPGYAPLGRRPFTVQGAAGVAWQFSWQPASGGRMEVRDIVVRLTTPAGRHAYLVQESAPAAAWTVTQPVFRTALSTFRARS